MLVEPFNLLVEDVLNAFPGAVAVVFEGQQHEARGATRSADGLEEDLGLEGEGAGVGVGIAVDDTGSFTWFAKKVGETWM